MDNQPSPQPRADDDRQDILQGNLTGYERLDLYVTVRTWAACLLGLSAAYLAAWYAGDVSRAIVLTLTQPEAEPLRRATVCICALSVLVFQTGRAWGIILGIITVCMAPGPWHALIDYAALLIDRVATNMATKPW